MLSDVETEHYRRHLSLPGFGIEKQLRLRGARVLLVGAGGLGCPIGLYLAAAGVGTIGVIDFDRVERSNLQRQIAHSVDTLGMPKVSSLIERLQAINPSLTYIPHLTRLNETNVNTLIANYDLIIDGTDNFVTRFLLADACYLAKKPLLQGAVFQYQGQVNLFIPGESACYRCLFREIPTRNTMAACADIGVLGVIPGMIGLMMATEALKFLTGMDTTLTSRILLYDALAPAQAQTLKSIALSRDEECPLCGKNPVITVARQANGIPCTEALDSIVLLSTEQAKSLIDKGIFLLDVRSQSEFQDFHLPNAYHLPINALNADTAQTHLPNDKPILIYCQKGIRSQNAARQLIQLGYTQVYSLAGGIESWQNKHLKPGAILQKN